MNITQLLLSALLVVPSVAVRAQERAPELPGLDTLRGMLRDAPLPPRVEAVVLQDEAGCPAVSLDGAQLRGRVFSSVVEVTGADGWAVGTVDSTDDGWVFKTLAGRLVANAVVKDAGGRRVVTVTGCDGAAIGAIEESEGWNGDRSFAVKDAAGAELGRSGRVGYLQNEWSVEGGGFMAQFKDNHWFYDSWRVRVTGESRLIPFLAMANSEANRRESSKRNRERMHDRHGRHGL